MDLARFEALAAAYGGELSRWPNAERDAAHAFQAREPELAAQLLHAEDDLDDALHAWRGAAPSTDLRTRVLASAPKPGAAKARGRWMWLTGAGLAAAGVSGIMFGAVLFTAVSSDIQADALVAQAAPDGASATTWLSEESS